MPFFVKIIIFIFASIYLVWISRRSIRNTRSHGFYRLFAWEAILVLVLLNLDPWFDDWLCPRQIASWILLASSVYLVIHGTLTLYGTGKPHKRRADSTLLGIEKTTALVTTGPYRFIRHPMYSSLVVGVWGVVLKQVSVIGITLAIIAGVLITLTAKAEEAENMKYFGESYRDYIKKTRMFIPYLF